MERSIDQHYKGGDIHIDRGVSLVGEKQEGSCHTQ